MILVIFGSDSDKHVYDKILKKLDEYKLAHKLKIASAHKVPELVDQILKEKYELIIAGAGLAAHLPGVIASKTLTPVIGVPVKSVFYGLDALLSIVQMPPGVPVMSVGVDKAEEAALNAKHCIEKYDKVNIVGEEEEEHVMKCAELLKGFGIKYEVTETVDDKAINIHFMQLDEQPERKEELVIYCPLLSKEDDKAEAALNILKHSTHGLWVGINNHQNAAIAAVEIMALHHKLEDSLIKFRKKMKQKFGVKNE